MSLEELPTVAYEFTLESGHKYVSESRNHTKPIEKDCSELIRRSDVDELVRYKLSDIITDVLGEADDDRIPEDVIWFSDGCTVADEIIGRMLNKIEVEDE